jgi:hypothetical protein
MRRLVVVVLAAGILAGCGRDPKQAVIPSDVAEWESDKEFRAAVERLPEEDRELFASYMARILMSEAFGGEGVVEGTTVGEAIDAERAWQRELELEEQRQRELAQRLEAERLAALKQMNAALTVTLLEIRYREEDWSADRFSGDFALRIGFENHAEVDIIGAKGVTVFKDVFGDVIKKVKLSNDDTIPAGGTSIWRGTLEYNEFFDEDKRLRSTDFSKLKFEWEPEMYVFADGTEMVMPNGE